MDNGRRKLSASRLAEPQGGVGGPALQINKRHRNEKMLKIFIQSSLKQRESATIACIWQILKGNHGSGSYIEATREGSGMP